MLVRRSSHSLYAPVLLLLAGFLFSGCLGFGGTRVGASPSLDEVSLDDVNASLRGRTAKIRLVEGSTIRFAEDVRVEPDSVSWRPRHVYERRTVATAEVSRIQAVPRGAGGPTQALKGGGIGLAAGAGIALLVVSTNECYDYGCLGQGIAALGLTLGGGLVGLIGGAIAHDGPSERVLYEGPIERYLVGGTASEYRRPTESESSTMREP